MKDQPRKWKHRNSPSFFSVKGPMDVGKQNTKTVLFCFVLIFKIKEIKGKLNVT